MNAQRLSFGKWAVEASLLYASLSIVATCFAAAPKNEKVETLANEMIAPQHNSSRPDYSGLKKLSPYCMAPSHYKVGKPPIRLSVLLISPNKSAEGDCSNTPTGFSTRGTAFLIPGYGLDKATLIPLGVAFARLGFGSVLVDLPGQGESGGSHIGYGFLEARYVNDLIRLLRASHDVHGKVVLMGISYGAAVAIDAAGLNPNVSTVIAIAPFARILPAIERYARAHYSKTFSRLTKLQFKHALSRAEQILGYKFEDYSPLDFTPKIAEKWTPNLGQCAKWQTASG